MNTFWINGEFVSANDATVSLVDRGFLYGDGLFETIRIYDGKPFAWKEHWNRLQAGADFLKIRIPFSETEAQKQCVRLTELNGQKNCVIRIQLTRGVGARGYAITGANCPTLAFTIHEAPAEQSSPKQWRLATSSLRLLAGDPLGQFKTCNKLHHIVARTEASEKGADDALLLNHRDEVAETTTCNLFWIRDKLVYTPPITSGALPGITRRVVMQLCGASGVVVEERVARVNDLLKANGIFLTSSVLELVEVTQLDNDSISRSSLTAQLFSAYQKEKRR